MTVRELLGQDRSGGLFFGDSFTNTYIIDY